MEAVYTFQDVQTQADLYMWTCVMQTQYRTLKSPVILRLPTYISMVVGLHAQVSFPLRLDQAVASQLVTLVGGSRQTHRSDVVWLRVGCDGVCAGLPDAGCEVQASFRVRYAVPIKDELRREARSVT